LATASNWLIRNLPFKPEGAFSTLLLEKPQGLNSEPGATLLFPFSPFPLFPHHRRVDKHLK